MNLNKEIKNDIDVVAELVSWEKDTRIHVDGCKWFGNPCSSQTSQRGEGRVGFWVGDTLISEVEFVIDESL